MGRFEVLTGHERRRYWSEEQKQALVAAAFAPGAIVADVARQADINSGQLYRWRRELQSTSTGFSEVVVSPVLSGASPPAPPAIAVVLKDGSHVHIPVSSPPDLAAAVVTALVRR